MRGFASRRSSIWRAANATRSVAGICDAMKKIFVAQKAQSVPARIAGGNHFLNEWNDCKEKFSADSPAGINFLTKSNARYSPHSALFLLNHPASLNHLGFLCRFAIGPGADCFSWLC